MRSLVLILAFGLASTSVRADEPVTIGLDLPLSQTPLRSTVIRFNGLDIPEGLGAQITDAYYFVNGTVSAKPPHFERWCSIPRDDLQYTSRMQGDYQVIGRFNVGGWSSTTRLILRSISESGPKLLRVSCQLGPLHIGQTFDAASFLYQLGGGTFATQFAVYLYSAREQIAGPVQASYSSLGPVASLHRNACAELTKSAFSAEGLALPAGALQLGRLFCQDVSTENLRESMRSASQANLNCAQTHRICEANFPLGLPRRSRFEDAQTTGALEQQRIYYVMPTLRWR